MVSTSFSQPDSTRTSYVHSSDTVWPSVASQVLRSILLKKRKAPVSDRFTVLEERHPVKASLWKMVASTTDDLDIRVFKATKQHFLQQNLNKYQQNRNFKLLSSCHRSVSLDPVRRLPMSNAERSRCIC
ncbi:hypothetical protein G6F61_004903 [Rhizopus arrhizus]|nr:hypothetical protein G6F61_004903 [Rhizopus arrhizus]